MIYIFNYLFGGNTAPATQQNFFTGVIDRVLDDYRKVKNSTKIGALDKQVFEEHISDLSELEQSVRDSVGTSGPHFGSVSVPQS